MRINLLKRTLAVSVFGLAALLGMSGIADAQNNRQPQKNADRRNDYERERREREQYDSLERLRRRQSYQQEDILEQQRADVERIEQYREEQRIKNQDSRYRVTYEGQAYEMDYDGAELLKEAVNTGYQQGYTVGKGDHKSKRENSYGSSVIYQNGTYGYQNYVDSALYQFYFREGFQRGYNDGYSNKNLYGKSTNGIRFISEIVSQEILNFQQF